MSLRWFTRSRPTLDETLSTLGSCEIRLKGERGVAGLRQEVGGDPRGDYTTLLVAMGTEPLDPQTYEPTEPYSDDVWHFDYEAIEDHGAYKSIAAHCIRLSAGALKCHDISDYVDVEAGVAWVEFDWRGVKDRIDLRVDNDWADPTIFEALNDRLAAVGSDRLLAQCGLGQDCLLICKAPQGIAAVNRATGLRFAPQFG